MSKNRNKIFDGQYRYDIALEEGAGSGMVAWACGLMVFFVTLALAVNFALTALTAHWVGGLAGNVTVELKAPGDAAQNILALQGRHPAVKSARLLDKEEVRKLVEPWLGTRIPDGVALPVLVDIALSPGADTARLERDIRALAPAATVDTHAETLSDLRTLTATARLFVLLLTGVITALAVVSIAGIVRAKFSIHGQEVETLHLIGAADEYIARQFRRHTLKGALKGAIVGLLAMIATLLAIGYATHTVDAALFPRLKFVPLQWVALILSPVLAGSLVAHFTAQRAVMRELAKLP